MARAFAGGRLVLATHNQGKLREIAATLSLSGRPASVPAAARRRSAS